MKLPDRLRRAPRRLQLAWDHYKGVPLLAVHDGRASSSGYLLPGYCGNGHSDSAGFGHRIRYHDFLAWLLGRFSHDTLVWK